ncbi:MAG: NnrS family protein [Marinosulfonomonas sp.]|nr:NnrS family protein [Marinosulfonomonas sp.]
MNPPILKKHGSKRERNWQGHAFFSGGFRPFFLFGALFAILSIALWLADLLGYSSLDTSLAPVDWHKHEMLFGYTSAVIAGFLFTAVPNWTGRFPVVGWPLIAIFVLWLAGRVAMLMGDGVPYSIAATIDAAFLPILGTVIAREIISGKNWRNLRVLAPVLMLGAANIWFHIDIANGGLGTAPIRLGFASILVLLMLIGGRVIPSFTRNWLARREPGKLPKPFDHYDTITVAASAIALGVWTAIETAPLLGTVFAALGVAHIIRLGRWAGLRTLSNPLLLALHIFYAFVPIGFLTLAAGMLMDSPAINTGALHVFGIGATGGLTLAVMIRASLGHTGRMLASDRLLNVVMVAVTLSVTLRVIGAVWPEYDWAITGSALAWIIAFGLFTFRVGPWLVKPRAAR